MLFLSICVILLSRYHHYSFEVDEWLDWLAEISHQVVELDGFQGSLLENIEVLPNHFEVFGQMSLGISTEETQVSAEHLDGGLSRSIFRYDEMSSW